MNKSQFESACVAAFGTNYTSDIATALRVSDRTVRAWRDGSRSIPLGLAAKMIVLLKQRSTVTAQAANTLKALHEKKIYMKKLASYRIRANK